MSDLFTELLEQITELPNTENYPPKDRYADFRQVFTGSEQGKRVYCELLSWGSLFNTKLQKNNPNLYQAGVNDSNRNFATTLMAAVNIEPQEPPTKARKK